VNLVAVLAHPDDEALFCAGALAKSAAEGHKVTLLCATKGERGEVNHPDLEPSQYPKGEALARLRASELEASCAALGIRKPIFLGHIDSGHPLETARQNSDAFIHSDPLMVARALCEHFKTLEPDVLITFDPYGMYGHVDHVMVHRATTAAFWLADRFTSNPPKRLWSPVRSASDNEDQRGEHLDMLESSLGAVIDVRRQALQIRAAIEAHRSQLGTPRDVEKHLEKLPNVMREERYILAGLRGLIPRTPLQDLFEGL
jgi:N-acetyl-1-D-myo-inositol-2-amino-2-deoxy-alpha-D-glucopyranoside deacetylase